MNKTLIVSGLIGALFLLGRTDADGGEKDENLRLRYDFNQVKGTVIKDQSARHQDGRLEGGANAVPDQHGNVLELSGSGQFVSVPGLSSLRITRGLTITAVLRLDDTQNTEPACADMILWKPDCFLFSRGPDRRLYFNLHNGKEWVGSLSSINPVPTGKYLHVAVTVQYVDNQAQGFAGYKANLWINGESVGGASFNHVAFAENGQPVDIGQGWGGPWCFTGRMATVSLYDRAFTEGEILADAAASPYVKEVNAPLAIPSASQGRLEALKAKATSPQARWIVELIGRTARDARFAPQSKAMLDCAEAMLADPSKPPFAWWQAKGHGMRIIEGARMNVALAMAENHCELLGLYDHRQQRDLLGIQGSLWTLQYLTPKGETIKLASADVASALTSAPVFTDKGICFAITWTTAATVTEPMAVSVRGDMTLQGRRLSMNLTVTNSSPEMILSEVIFPQISFQRLAHGIDTVIAPKFFGESNGHAVENYYSYSGMYPSPDASMQFGAYYDDKNGVFFATEDPEAQTKRFTIQGKLGQLFTSWCWYPGHSGQGGNDFVTSGNAVIEAFEGDWFDAGQIYKRWLNRKAPWFPQHPRTDTPAWFREMTVWVRDFDRAALPKLSNYLGLPLGLHWYGWNKEAFDDDYPRFTPKDDFRADVAFLQSHQVRVKPYFNYRIWDTKDQGETDFEYTKIGWPAAVKSRDGKPENELYGGRTFSAMCPSSAAYQAKMKAVFERVSDDGVDALYLDQMNNGGLCFDAAHGHSLGGGNNWLANGYWKYFGEYRKSLKARHPDLAFDSEDEAEPFAHLVDGFMSWRSFVVSAGATPLPLFPSIYAGRVQFTGCDFSGDAESAFFKLARQLTNSEQLGWTTCSQLTSPLNADLRSFLRTLAHVRIGMLAWFNEGTMAHPLKFGAPLPEVSANWGYGSRIIKTPKIEHSVWLLDGAKAVVFVNASSTPVTNRVATAELMAGLAKGPLSLNIMTANGNRRQAIQPGRDEPLTMAPRSAQVWVVSPDKHREKTNRHFASLKDAFSRIAKFKNVMDTFLFVPTPTPPLAARTWINAVDAQAFFGCKADQASNAVCHMDNPAVIYFGTVDFGARSPAKLVVELAVDPNYAGGNLAFVADSLEGPIIAQVDSLTSTGGFDLYRPLDVAVKKPLTGQHAVFAIFRYKPQNLRKWKAVD